MLIQRNMEVISSYYYWLNEDDNIDERTATCLAEIAENEGQSHLRPVNCDDGSSWEAISPPGWIELGKTVLG
jgi:hypothetical protein